MQHNEVDHSGALPELMREIPDTPIYCTKKGEATYSPKSHSAPHFEGHYVEGIEEWASWYCFNKKEDGTYEAELDEVWDEGSHYGGGTINVDIPKEWFALSYDDFLEHVITLAAAKHYGFTVNDLKDKEGLMEFFGFKEKEYKMTIDTTNMCSHLQKKLFEEDGIYHHLWLAMLDDPELTAVVRSRQLHIYRNDKKVLVLAGKADPKVIREDKLCEMI